MRDRWEYADGASGPNIQFPVLRKPNYSITGLMAIFRTARRHKAKTSLLLLPLLLAACGSSEVSSPRGQMAEKAQEFSTEDKQAALALSIGNVSALSDRISAYDQSLSCSIALESVYAKLSENGQLDTAMLQTIEQVRTSYNQRVQQLGSADNKSPAEITADRQQRAEEIPEPSERGQIAIGCLRAMS